MFRKFTILFSLIFFSSLVNEAVIAQANTLVMGTLKYPGAFKEIKIQVNQKYLNDDYSVYESTISPEGRFAFVAQIEAPLLVTLVYHNKKTLLYLEPNDTLLIDGNASSFGNLNFSGKGGANNTLLHQYLKENPQELDMFKMTQ